MTKKQLENALDSVINRFKEESGKSIDYCNDDYLVTSQALSQQNKAIENAFNSIKKILLTEK